MIDELLNTVALFTAFLPIWQDRPLTDADLNPGPAPYEVTADTVAVQQEALRSSDPLVRLAAAEDLGQTDDPQAARLLAAALPKETDRSVLAVILQQLASTSSEIESGLEKNVEPFLKHENASVRYWAVRLHSRLGDASCRDLQAVAETEKDPAVWSAAWDGLKLQADRVSPSFLKPFFKDENPQVRAAAVRVAACRSRLEGELVQAAGDSSVMVRCAAAEGVALVPASHLGKLVSSLIKDAHAGVRAQAAVSLAARTDQTAVPYLLVLVKDQDSEVRRLAVEGLGKQSGSQCAQAVIARLTDASAVVRQAAETAAVNLHERTAVDGLAVAVLPTANPAARLHALRLLGQLAIRDHATAIQEALERESAPENVAAAIAALGRMETVAAVPGIVRRAGHRDPGVRGAVAAALGLLKQPAADDCLKQLAADADTGVRLRALEAIGRTGHGQAFDATLIRVLKSYGAKTHPEERARACWAASRVLPLSQDAAQAMVVLATRPVIPGEMGEKMFDTEQVLVSASLSLAAMAREQDWARPLCRKVVDLHATVLPPSAASSPNSLLPTPAIQEAARQVRAFLNGDDAPKPARRPREPFNFRYQSIGT